VVNQPQCGGKLVVPLRKEFDLFVPGGQEQLRIIRGVVDKEGTKKEGAGFDVKKVAGKSGVYEITFNPAFSSTPAASANQIALGEKELR
jgi:hypothetical protein